MAENWKPYICNVNGNLASIFLNLDLCNVAPILSKPWLLWIWVYFQTPRPDGLSDSREAPILYKIEDALEDSVVEVCHAIPCGRITTQGRREFYFYGETKKDLRQAVEAAFKNVEEYRFDFGDRKDPEWEQYLNVLYPSDEDLQRIANIDLLDALKKRGDVLTVVREVRHWIYLRSEPSRALFKDAAISLGFKVIKESKFDREFPFGITIGRSQSIVQPTIDQTVIELLHLAQRFDGEYDGWETPVITQ